MAVPENNRRFLPRVNGNETRELQRRAAETDKKVQGNINDIRTFTQRTEKAEQTIQDGNRQIQDIKKKFEKQEKDVVQLQNDVRATDQKATKALNDSKANTTKINQIEKSASISNIKNSFASLRRDFGSNNQTLESSVGSLRTNLDSSILTFKTADQGAEQRLQSIQTSLNNSLLSFRTKEDEIGQRIANNTESINNITTQLNVAKVDFAKSIDTVVTDNSQDKESILALSANVDALKKNELADEKARQKDLRIGAADKRREIKENILEGSKKALANTGQALAKTTNSLLGGFNLIDAIKAVLSRLALGLLIVKFPEIYKNITENIEKWKRVAAVFLKSFLRPASKFFNLLIDVGAKVVKWVFKGLNLVRKAIGAVIEFSFNAGKKLISSIVRFLGKIFDIIPKPPRPGVNGSKGKGSTNSDPSKPPRTGGSGPGDVDPASGDSTAPKPKPKGRMGQISDWFGQQARNAGSAVVRGGDAITGGAFTRMKDQVTSYLKKASEITKPLFSAISSAKSSIATSIKNKDPKSLREGLSNLFQDIQGKTKSIGGKLDDILSPVFRLIKPFGKAGFGLLRGLGREARIGLPIDMLINKYVLGQDWGESIIRAVGSTLGTFAFAGIPIPGTGIVGGDLGDYLFARTARDLFGVQEGYEYDNNLVTLIPGFSDLMNGVFSSISGSNSQSTSPAGSAVTLSSNASTTSSSPSPFAPSISPSSIAQAASTTPVSQYLRKPTAISSSASTGSTSSSGSSSSMAQITLPAQSVDMPTQVVGDRGESLDKTPAQSIPFISPTNPAMDYLQIAAAQTFEMQLV